MLEASPEELSCATQCSLHSRGLRTAAAIVKKISEPREAALIGKKNCQPQKAPIRLTPDEALASFVQNKLTKSQYISIHCETKKHNADIYPIYVDVLASITRCYPENITVTEFSAHVRSEVTSRLTAIYKWGCDGAASQ